MRRRVLLIRDIYVMYVNWRTENSDSNICVQFARQVAAVLNDSRSDIASKQPEPVRIDTMCSHENEGMEKRRKGKKIKKRYKELQLVYVSPSADSESNAVQPQQNIKDLELCYAEDQWSPRNPEGKKQYDREFLLQLQSQPMSLRKPNNLPNLDVIKDKVIWKLIEVNRAPVPVLSNPLPRMPDEVESIRLGPGGRGLQSWGRGSSGGTKTTADSDKTALTKRFSAFPGTILLQLWKEEEVPKIGNIKSALNGPEYNEDDMERKTKLLIDEFLRSNDFEEAIKCVTELSSPNTVHVFINAAINQVLERSSRARYSLGQLLSALLKKKIITFDQYKKGFAVVLEIIDDYALDIPLIWDYMGEILEPMIEDIETPFKLLTEVLQPCAPSEKAGMLVSSILHCAAKRKGTIKLGEVWRESGVQWTDIIGTDRNVAEFIEKHKLEFTVSPTKFSPQIQMSMEEMRKHLLNLLEKNAELEEVFDWIDANVPDTSDPTFVRALVTAVHENCFSGSGTTWELNTSKLKSRIPLISRYVSTNEKLQLQALYAAQALSKQLRQPSGLLHQVFDILYDEGVISDESLMEWEQCHDPNEAEKDRIIK
ncbi:Eukaryotic translation initiation factor 4 gamma 3 [Araneus ventricosus]|uniref:Eukaryotic translation initiation factor 4 gamma 3 n=1 Tax=Araneus ventricosus TaxID=182803 RepID=A0A4Y2NI38_ARAVE|nr:Eukaryotic translation initiation factor 4 gamma 3 [Araneus ventricosus]